MSQTGYQQVAPPFTRTVLPSALCWSLAAPVRLQQKLQPFHSSAIKEQLCLDVGGAAANTQTRKHAATPAHANISQMGTDRWGHGLT